MYIGNSMHSNLSNNKWYYPLGSVPIYTFGIWSRRRKVVDPKEAKRAAKAAKKAERMAIRLNRKYNKADKARPGLLSRAANAVGSGVSMAGSALSMMGATPDRVAQWAIANKAQINGVVGAIAQKSVIRKANKQRARFLKDNPHINYQLGVVQRNQYIDSILGKGASSLEGQMKSNYDTLKKRNNGNPLRLAGVTAQY